MARISTIAPIDNSLSNLDNLLSGFSQDSADAWLRQLFGSYDASMRSEFSLGINKNEKEYFDKAVLLGFVKELPQAPRVGTNCPVIVVSVSMRYDLVGRDSRVAQFNLAKRIIKEAVAIPRPGIHGLPAQGLFFFHDDHGHFRLSLVSGNVENKRFVFNSAKRQSFFVNEVIEDIQQFGSLPRRTIKKMGETTTAQAIHDILVDIARVRGFDYVHKLRDRAIQEEIVVTVQRN